MILTWVRFLVVFGLIFILPSCASLSPSFEKPVVSISSFRPLSSGSMNSLFEIGLHIINPNNVDLKLQGVAYTAAIAGHDILTGVSNDLPVIPAYGEVDVKLKASADLLGSIRLVASLMNGKHKALDYELEVKLDIGNFIPAIRVKKSGLIAMLGVTQ
jgi:LEA14-like dessication related protein